MEMVRETKVGRGDESAKRRRMEGGSSGRIDEESATTEQNLEVEEENISEDEQGNWADIDREVSMGKVLTEDEEMDKYRRGLEYILGGEFGCFEQESE
jgi:hypothetical protein